MLANWNNTFRHLATYGKIIHETDHKSASHCSCSLLHRVQFVLIKTPAFPYSWPITRFLRATRRVPLMHLTSTSLLVRFGLLNLQFSMYFFVDHCLYFCTFSIVIVLSVLLRFTASDFLSSSSSVGTGFIIEYIYSRLPWMSSQYGWRYVMHKITLAFKKSNYY